MEDSRYVDVLIVGAGAAGLTLAIDLARRGVSHQLIDRLEGPFKGSRGKGIQPRTQEVFEDLGVIDAIAAAGGSYPPQRIYRDDGAVVDRQEFAEGHATFTEPYPSPLLVPQFGTEAVLRSRIASLGGHVDYGVELIEFVDETGFVSARVADASGSRTIRCRYLVGADGGRSSVRRTLAVDFPGKTLGVRAIVADIEIEGLDRTFWHRFNEGDMARQISFCPLPRSNVFQLQAPIGSEGEADVSKSGLQAFVDERLPDRSIVVHAVHWASAYSMNARLADRYRVGNVFLVGDAAHIHPPTGGQGLNTSVQDAYNLGWKLASVLADAPPALLDTYEEERRPIAAAMLGLATRLLERAGQGDTRRGREVHQMDLNYRGSSLAPPASKTGGAPWPGDRMPDATLRGAARLPRRLFDLIAGPHWTLLTRGETGVMAVPGLRVLRIGQDCELQNDERQLVLDEGEQLLIRPDGYVGARFAGPDTTELRDYLARVLPRQS